VANLGGKILKKMFPYKRDFKEERSNIRENSRKAIPKKVFLEKLLPIYIVQRLQKKKPRKERERSLEKPRWLGNITCNLC